jgi:hypothetical protein
MPWPARRRGGFGLKPGEDLALVVARGAHMCARRLRGTSTKEKGGECASVHGAPRREMGASAEWLELPWPAGLPAGLHMIMRANSTETGL